MMYLLIYIWIKMSYYGKSALYIHMVNIYYNNWKIVISFKRAKILYTLFAFPCRLKYWVHGILVEGWFVGYKGIGGTCDALVANIINI